LLYHFSYLVPTGEFVRTLTCTLGSDTIATICRDQSLPIGTLNYTRSPSGTYIPGSKHPDQNRFFKQFFKQLYKQRKKNRKQKGIVRQLPVFPLKRIKTILKQVDIMVEKWKTKQEEMSVSEGVQENEGESQALITAMNLPSAYSLLAPSIPSYDCIPSESISMNGMIYLANCSNGWTPDCLRYGMSYVGFTNLRGFFWWFG
jgi:hypothetical protein